MVFAHCNLRPGKLANPVAPREPQEFYIKNPTFWIKRKRADRPACGFADQHKAACVNARAFTCNLYSNAFNRELGGIPAGFRSSNEPLPALSWINMLKCV